MRLGSSRSSTTSGVSGLNTRWCAYIKASGCGNVPRVNPAITATGRAGTVIFDGQAVTIKRSGILAMATAGIGEKRIPIAHIAAVQFKPAHIGVLGFIQFTVAGGVERRSKFGRTTQDAINDENSLTFWKKQQRAFEALRDAIEAAQRRPQSQTHADLGSQLGQLAQLHAQGALTEDEYAAAKARLLG